MGQMLARGTRTSLQLTQSRLNRSGISTMRTSEALLAAAFGLALAACGIDSANPVAGRTPADSSPTATTVTATLTPTSTHVSPAPTLTSYPEVRDWKADFAFWAQLAFDAHWVVQQPTLEALANDADAVVVATVSGVHRNDLVYGDLPAEQLTFVNIDLKVLDDVRGSRHSTMVLRMETPVGTDQYDAWFDKFAETPLPTGPALFVLTATSESKEVYRVINSESIWLSDTDGVFPAFRGPDGDLPASLQAEVEAVENLQQLAELAARSRSTP